MIGFLVSAFLAGYLNFKTNLLNVFVKLIFCVSIIYILGMFWLGILIGWDKPIFELGAKPFLLAELFKLLILTLSCAGRPCYNYICLHILAYCVYIIIFFHTCEVVL